MYFFVKHFLTLNCNKCSNNCDPQSWLSYCFQVVDLISLDLLMTQSRNIQNLGYHGRRYVGMSRTELLLHCNSKENEVNGALSSSQTSTHLKWVLWNLHPYQSIGVTWSKIISSACTDPIASLSGLWKCFSICVIQVTLIYFYFFPSYHIWLFRTATFRPRFLARGKASEEPTEGVVSKLWKITLKAYFFFKRQIHLRLKQERLSWKSRVTCSMETSYGNKHKMQMLLLLFKVFEWLCLSLWLCCLWSS